MGSGFTLTASERACRLLHLILSRLAPLLHCASCSTYAVWADMKEKELEAKAGDIEREINSFRANQLRDSTRQAYIRQAMFLASKLDFAGSARAWSQAREYSATAKQVAEVNGELAEMALMAKECFLVQQALGGGEVAAEMKANPVFHNKVMALRAIAHMLQKQYGEAAKKLSQLRPVTAAGASGCGVSACVFRRPCLPGCLSLS